MREDVGARAHEGNEPWAEECTACPEDDGGGESEGDGLDGCVGGAAGVVFADAAGDGGGGADAESDGDRVEDREE